MQARSDLLPPEEHYAEKTCLQKESGEYFVTKERPGDASRKCRVVAPVGAELIGHDQAGHYAHGEGHRKNVRPEMVEFEIDRVLLQEPQAFKHGKIACKPDRERR